MLPAEALAPLPGFAAWRFVGAADGFEVVYAAAGRLSGHTTAVEAGQPYAVHYEIELDDRWRTRVVRIWNQTLAGNRSTVLTSDGEGRWTVDGAPAPHLDGPLDVDLEASVCTNTLPVHRFAMPVGQTVTATAVYVQALDLTVRRLDQSYRRLESGLRFDYRAEGGFAAELVYDDAGLVIDYPGIATRFA